MKDLGGARFGRWIVLDEFYIKNKQKLWKCQCACGNSKYVYESNLVSGKSKSCGCMSAEAAKGRYHDLAGMTFGKLQVESKAENRRGRVCWNCVCECGTTCVVTAHELKAGKTKSCGCATYEKGTRIKNIAGQTFGYLKALSPTEERDEKGSVMWKCMCECGREMLLSENALVHGNYKSCGCHKRAQAKELTTYLHFYEGTCLEYLNRTIRKDNKTGVVGVSKTSNGKYVAQISFQGKSYHLGKFESLEKAKAARKEAEEQLFGAFISAYHAWREDERPAKEDLVFQVDYVKGEFLIHSNYSQLYLGEEQWRNVLDMVMGTYTCSLGTGGR